MSMLHEMGRVVLLAMDDMYRDIRHPIKGLKVIVGLESKKIRAEEYRKRFRDQSKRDPEVRPALIRGIIPTFRNSRVIPRLHQLIAVTLNRPGSCA